MNATTAQDLSNHFNELSSYVGDTRAMLKAIEAMLFESTGHDIERTLHNAGAAEFANDLHCLTTIALDRARKAVDLADEFEPMLIALRWPAPHQNTESAEGEMVLSADEAAFLASYRNCSKKGQKAIRQLALTARNGLSMPPRPHKLKGSP